MRILFKVDAPGVETDYGRYAVVDFDPHLMKEITRRRELLRKTCEQDTVLKELHFHDRKAWFYDDCPKGVHMDEDDFVVLSEDVELAADDTPTDLDRMVIGQEGVTWMAGLKHLGFYVYTREIGYKELEKYVLEEEHASV